MATHTFTQALSPAPGTGPSPSTPHRWLELRRFHPPKPLHLILQAEFQLLQPNLFQLFRVSQEKLRTQRIQPACVQAVFLHKLLDGRKGSGLGKLRELCGLHEGCTSSKRQVSTDW